MPCAQSCKANRHSRQSLVEMCLGALSPRTLSWCVGALSPRTPFCARTWPLASTAGPGRSSLELLLSKVFRSIAASRFSRPVRSGYDVCFRMCSDAAMLSTGFQVYNNPGPSLAGKRSNADPSRPVATQRPSTARPLANVSATTPPPAPPGPSGAGRGQGAGRRAAGCGGREWGRRGGGRAELGG